MQDWLIFLLELLLLIPLKVLFDHVRPSIRSRIERSIFSSRQKRIRSLMIEYARIARYRKDAALLTVSVIRELAGALTGILLTLFAFLLVIYAQSAAADFRSVFTALGWAYVFLVSVLAFSMIYDGVILPIDNVLHFEIYKEKTRAILKNLGGNPENLDKGDNLETGIV